MTSKAQITKVAGRDGVDARVVERDYVLAHFVALIADSDTEKRSGRGDPRSDEPSALRHEQVAVAR